MNTALNPQQKMDAHMTTNNTGPKNIRAFNWLTLEILRQLYEAFPEPIELKGLRFTISKLFDIGRNQKKPSI